MKELKIDQKLYASQGMGFVLMFVGAGSFINLIMLKPSGLFG
jgi:hypothetical protein